MLPRAHEMELISTFWFNQKSRDVTTDRPWSVVTACSLWHTEANTQAVFFFMMQPTAKRCWMTCVMTSSCNDINHVTMKSFLMWCMTVSYISIPRRKKWFLVFLQGIQVNLWSIYKTHSPFNTWILTFNLKMGQILYQWGEVWQQRNTSMSDNNLTSTAEYWITVKKWWRYSSEMLRSRFGFKVRTWNHSTSFLHVQSHDHFGLNRRNIHSFTLTDKQQNKELLVFATFMSWHTPTTFLGVFVFISFFSCGWFAGWRRLTIQRCVWTETAEATDSWKLDHFYYLHLMF